MLSGSHQTCSIGQKELTNPRLVRAEHCPVVLLRFDITVNTAACSPEAHTRNTTTHKQHSSMTYTPLFHDLRREQAGKQWPAAQQRFYTSSSASSLAEGRQADRRLSQTILRLWVRQGGSAERWPSDVPDNRQMMPGSLTNHPFQGFMVN